MQDKKLSELSSMPRTALDGVDLIPILDLNENVANNRNKVVPLEELYQYTVKRFLAGGDVLYLLQGVNSTQNGYFNSLIVNKLISNTNQNGSVIDIDASTQLRAPGGIALENLSSITNGDTGIQFGPSNTIIFEQNNVEAARFTAARRMLLGTSQNRAAGNLFDGNIQLEGTNSPTSAIHIICNTNANNGGALVLGKSRSETTGGSAAVVLNDNLGSIVFVGGNSTDLSNIAASITGQVDANPFNGGDTSDLPGRLVFSTSSTGSAVPSERVRIDSTGVLSFNGNANTGLYSSSADVLDIKAGGVRVVSAESTGVSLFGQINLYGFDPYKTVLDSAPITDDRIILFPDVNGTVVVSGSTGTVTSQMIADNTILDGDININADIAVAKLMHGSSRQILQTNSTGTDVEWSSDINIPGSFAVSSTSTFNGQVTVNSTLTAQQFTPSSASVPINGMYYPNTNQLGFSTNSTSRLIIDASGQIEAVNAGMAASPSWTFFNDPNTGIYNPAADSLAFSIGGNEALRINSSGAFGIGGSSFGSTGQIIISQGSNAAPTWNSLSGDVTINGLGVTAIAAGVITDADINAAANISDTKLGTISTTNKVSLSSLNVTGATEIGAAIQDNDLFIVDDTSANAKRSTFASRISDYIYNKVSGDINIAFTGITSIKSSVALTGVPTAPTASADTNTTQLATTAFVLGQAGTSLPLMNGSASAGLSSRFARADHVHDSDTSKANLNSPGFTGIPTAPTAGVDNNTAQIATTAYVVGQGYLKTSTASTTYAPIASPGFTGTPTAPTAATSANSTQIATTAYVKNVVDSTFQGLVVQPSCRLATTANITLSGTQTIDGVSALEGNRVLVKNQSTESQNGVYLVASGSWSRATDFDSNAEVVPGSYFYIEDGNDNGATTWVLGTTGTIIVGTTGLTFNKFSSADSVTAGDGLVKVGTTMNVGTVSTARIVVNSDNIDLATTGVSANTYQSVTVDVYGRVTAGSNPTTVSGYGLTDAAIINQTMHIGTTPVAINRTSSNLSLTGIASVQMPGTVSGTLTLQPPSNAGANTLTFPATTGNIVTTGDSGTVTGTIIASNTISNANIAANAGLQFSKLEALEPGKILVGNSSSGVVATTMTGDVQIDNTGTTSITAGAIVNADINDNAAISDVKLATISTAGKVSNNATTATHVNVINAIVTRDGDGSFSANTITANTFSGQAGGLTNLPAARIVGTIPSSVLGASNLHVGTTQIALNRTSAIQGLTGISSVALQQGTGTPVITLQPPSSGSVSTITLPSGTTGVVVTTGDTGTVTSNMIANGTIVDGDISNSASITHSKLANITAGNILLGNASNIPTSTSVTGDITISNTGVTAITAGAIVNADINAGAAIAGTKIAPDFGSQNIVTTGTLSASTITSTSTFKAAYGTTTAPSISATSDTNTGFLWESGFTDSVSIVAGGIRVSTHNSNSVSFYKDIYIGTDNNTAATAGTTTINSDALVLQGKYYDTSSKDGNWIIVNDITSATPTSNLTFAWNAASTTTYYYTFNNNGEFQCRSINFNLPYGTTPSSNSIYQSDANELAFRTNGSDRLRILSNGVIVAGASSGVLSSSTTTNFNYGNTQLCRYQTVGTEPGTVTQAHGIYNNVTAGVKFGTSYFRSRGTSVGSTGAVSVNDALGCIEWNGDDGSYFSTGAAIIAYVDSAVTSGLSSTGAVPSRLVAYTALGNGTNETPRENWRITHDSVVCTRQPAPQAITFVSNSATATIDNLKARIITMAPTAASTLNLPTGSSIEGGFNGLYNDISFDWSAINTAGFAVTISGATGHTITGAASISANTSAQYRTRRTAANTYVTYRLS